MQQDACSLLAQVVTTLQRIESELVGGSSYHVRYITSTRNVDFTENPYAGGSVIASPDESAMCPFISRGIYVLGLDTDVVLHLSSRDTGGPWGPIFQVPKLTMMYFPIMCMAHESVAVNAGGTYQLMFISKI